MTQTTYFISDLHLSPERDDITECFERFMQTQARDADALYVLGDLFEAWIGDDDTSPFSLRIAAQFRQLSQNIPIYFIRGNRDFLLGRRFCKMAGMTLLKEQTVIDLYGTKVLIMHGDELCTLDHSYQKFRKIIRHPLVKMCIKTLPLNYRRKLAKKARQKSVAVQKNRNMDIMDVVQQDVLNALNIHQVETLIHGHTHQPNIHSVTEYSATARRIVLGDWYDQGSILEVTPDALNLRALKHHTN